MTQRVRCTGGTLIGGTATLTKRHRKYKAPKNNFLWVILELLLTCSAHARQGSWMGPNARALVHHVKRAHRAGGTLYGGGVGDREGGLRNKPEKRTVCAPCTGPPLEGGGATGLSSVLWRIAWSKGEHPHPPTQGQSRLAAG